MGLGTCTSMTLRMHAQLKKPPLTRVRLSHRKIHDGKVDEITRRIFLQGELSEAQRARLVEIVTRCPVNRTLTSEIKVRSRLAPSWEPQPWDAD